MTVETPANTPEPSPTANASEPLWEMVQRDAEKRFGGLRYDVDLLDDMRARDAFGRAKYGVPLQAGNGRDALVDLYQEILDACVYAKQCRVEGDACQEYEYHTLLDMAFGLRKTISRRRESP